MAYISHAKSEKKKYINNTTTNNNNNNDNNKEKKSLFGIFCAAFGTILQNSYKE